jgi:hypothetical protein
MLLAAVSMLLTSFHLWAVIKITSDVMQNQPVLSLQMYSIIILFFSLLLLCYLAAHAGAATLTPSRL